ncbi:hypothetical protein HDV00_009775 [Rhizophlyctis rosea]|nr:hypothetical protein HDV00_009775 [Rhizophlyctis rosea]
MSSKGGKLNFKGDKTEKKKKKRKAVDAVEEDTPQEGWVLVDSIEDFTGPILILSPATDPPSTLTASPTSPLTKFTSISSSPSSSTDPTTTLKSYEPTSSSEVYIPKRLPDSRKITFRSAHDKYLGTDKFGVVSCASEAISPNEEWEVVQREDGWALMSFYGKFLRCESDGTVRCDSDEMGFREVVRFKCQAANKSGRKKRREKERIDVGGLEVDKIKQFHSWGGDRLVTTQEDTRSLYKAKKDGQLNEALLDRRAKLKSDKFCK